MAEEMKVNRCYFKDNSDLYVSLYESPPELRHLSQCVTNLLMVSSWEGRGIWSKISITAPWKS
jgi:hypothetical protein